jgi:N-hydroxyarylamine O-acetyltransferase
MLDIDRYLERIGFSGDTTDLAALQRAQVVRVPYENLDVQLGREISLEVDDLVSKLVDRRRGGYCFELNSLFASVLVALGHSVTTFLGRVRISDAASPRPATHMVLLVDGSIIDVGFGAATPLGPVPLGGAASYGPWTWRTERIRTPEGEEGWGMWFHEQLLYTFTEEPRHPVDFVTPNHFSSTHPRAIFTQLSMVQRWQDDDAQLGLVDATLTTRRATGDEEVTRLDLGDVGDVLADRFDITLSPSDLALLQDRIRARGAV